MVEYDKFEVSKRVYINKTNDSCEWSICHYCYFLNINFRFEPEICNGCHDLMHVTIVTVKANDYRIHFLSMSKKDEAINLLRNDDLTEKIGTL